MNETVSTIIQAAYQPISLIIIGVGNGDFGAMETLDGDNGLVDVHGNRAKRDIVQFVPYNRFRNNPVALAQDVLAELPSQLVDYMRLIGKNPNPPQVIDIANMQVQNSAYPVGGNAGPMGNVPPRPADINKQYNTMLSQPYQGNPNLGAPAPGFGAGQINQPINKQYNSMMSQPYQAFGGQNPNIGGGPGLGGAPYPGAGGQYPPAGPGGQYPPGGPGGQYPPGGPGGQFPGQNMGGSPGGYPQGDNRMSQPGPGFGAFQPQPYGKNP